MQIACLNGCNNVSVELGKLILSLDYTDSYCVVLLLDYYLLQSKDDTIFKYMGIDSVDTELTLRMCASLTSPLNLTVDDSMTLNDLPNWWYTLTLTYLNKNQHSNARIALQHALTIAPNYVKSLLKQIDPLKLTSSTWKELLNHYYFQNSKNNLNGLEELFERLSDGYALRNYGVWSKENNMNFLLKTVKEFLNNDEIGINERFEIQNKKIKKWKNNNKLVKKYTQNIDLDDFKEEFPRMPAEANPLDNTIANPDLLDNEQGLLRTHLLTHSRTHLLTLIGALAFQPNAAMIGLENVFIHYLFNNNRNHEHQGIFGRQLFRGWRLDLTAPLLQLFWMSLLPFFYL